MIKPLVAALCALVYVVLFELNRWVFSVEFSAGVNYIFLPAGARLFAVLLLGVWGAIGIALGSAFLVTTAVAQASPLSVVVIALISGFSPWLAKVTAEKALHIETDPRRMSGPVLFQLSLLFAVVSALPHQAWFVVAEHSSNFLEGLVIMATGDLVGTLIFMYAVKGIDALVLTLRAARRH